VRDKQAIELRSVRKSYDGQTLAVDQVSLAVPEGRLLALLGPSGCGKSTLLRLIAGLEQPDAGEIAIAGRRVAGSGTWTPPEARHVGLVFQDGALFPHLTVGQNIAFGLQGAGRVEQARRIQELLELVDLNGMEQRYPHQLSGGQQQRVALARALAPSPPVMLLDEPFANLDAALRRELAAQVEQIVHRAGATTVFVTHDQEEALSIADLVAVMEAGHILQLGTPRAIYEQPATRAVAAFVGEATFVAAEASDETAHSAIGTLKLAKPAQGMVEALLRPENVEVLRDPSAGAVVEHATYLGYDQIVDVRIPDGTLVRARLRPRPGLQAGESVRLQVIAPVVAFPLAQGAA
jgi:iron(III) transport system ATP-binding protein